MSELLPVQFDANEWFVMLSIAGSGIAAWLLPRRFPAILTLTLLSIGIGVSVLADMLFAAPPADLFDANDKPGLELFDILVYFQFPAHAYIYTYIYDRLRIKGVRLLIYIVLWSLAGIMAEIAASYFEVFHFDKGWKYRYSFAFYLIVQPSLLVLFHHLKMAYVKLAQQADTNP